jgi:hypothetical protein
VNTHFQLLWSSVFAPATAVDLARQHPSAYRLGWIYVGILLVWSFVCEVIVKYVVQPVTQTPVEPSLPGLEWMDTIAGLTVLSVLIYSFIYIFQRWYWPKFASSAISQQAVDAAIVAGFAVSTLILLPEYVLLEVLRSSGLMAETIGLVICVGIGVFFYTLYFSHGLGISIAKSFWLNVLFLVLVVIALIVVVVVLSLVSAMITGLPVDAIVGAPEVSQ